MKQITLSHLMYLSWEIQRKRRYNRSRALMAAWAIWLNEDITVFHLVRKHSHERYSNKVQAESLSLF
jgi:predicted amidophosphoribosyltransferase